VYCQDGNFFKEPVSVWKGLTVRRFDDLWHHLCASEESILLRDKNGIMSNFFLISFAVITRTIKCSIVGENEGTGVC